MRSHKHYWSDIVNPTGIVPAGGNNDQLLAKASNGDYDTEWIDQAALEGILPLGGSDNQLLVKASNNDYDTEWIDLEGMLPPGGEEGQIPVKESDSDYDYTWEDPSVLQNYIVDGDFNFWYEGASQTSNGYGSDTMWNNRHTTPTTKTHSQQDFILGQTDVLGNPKYYSRTSVSSVTDPASSACKRQKIEDVRLFSGETVTCSFWAKADSSKNIAFEVIQSFGTGGSPSSDVNTIASQLILLTTAWAKYTITFTIPSITGKTLGTDLNDFSELRWWFDAGSNFDTRTAGLGQQSGTFDIARVRLVEGAVDGDGIEEIVGDILQTVNRYFERLGTPPLVGHYFAVGKCTGSDAAQFVVPFKRKRATPSVVLTGYQVAEAGSSWEDTNSTVATTVSHESFRVLATTAASVLSAGDGSILRGRGDGSSYIDLDARL